MQDPRLVTEQLARQFDATLAMLETAIEKCPDALWADPANPPCFWHEAYHALFWCDNFVGGAKKPFEFRPVGVDIDPRLFSPPGPAPGREELIGLLATARGHIAERLAAMTDAELGKADRFGEESPEFSSVLHRHLYGLRHGQHHVGKLSQRLHAAGIGHDAWRG